MTCPRGDQCLSPKCRGRSWVASSHAKADVEAFKAEVVAWMKLMDSRDVNAGIATIDAASRHPPCVLG